MSDKLKIMQEPVAAKSTRPVSHWRGQRNSVWYKVCTCSVPVYYIEEHACLGSLRAVLTRLEQEFAVDAFGYCGGCKAPSIQEISVVARSSVPAESDARRLVFVSRLN
jgi:hypothetical protein